VWLNGEKGVSFEEGISLSAYGCWTSLYARDFIAINAVTRWYGKSRFCVWI